MLVSPFERLSLEFGYCRGRSSSLSEIMQIVTSAVRVLFSTTHFKLAVFQRQIRHPDGGISTGSSSNMLPVAAVSCQTTASDRIECSSHVGFKALEEVVLSMAPSVAAGQRLLVLQGVTVCCFRWMAVRLKIGDEH